MAVEIKVPPLGESVVEATVGRWTKSAGDAVARDEVLVELETDKITVEVSAPEAGTLASIAKKEGDTVGIGDLLGSVEAGAPAAVGAGTGADSGGADDEAEGAENAPQPPAAQTGAEGDSGNGTGGATSPSVRRIAEERGIDLSRVQGSGPRGRITVEDLEENGQPTASPDAAPAPREEKAAAPAPAREDGRPVERERMSRRRQTIARRLVEAQQTTASLTTFNEVDLSAVMAMRKRRQEEFVKQHGIKLGFMSFFVKASIVALKQFPRLNGEIDGNEIVLKHFYDIGIAVGTDEGLVVPVIRDADSKSFAGIEHAIAEVAVKARDGKLALSDLQGGTFTITNGGIYGSMLSTPILNPPQVGILGMHNIIQRPMVIDGEIQTRPMMYVALTYDHRMVDGSEAVQFLVAIKRMLEEPETMLLEG